MSFVINKCPAHCVGYKLVYIIAEAERKWIPTIKDALTNRIIAYLEFKRV